MTPALLTHRAGLWLLLLASATAAQERAEAVATRIPEGVERPEIDGVLDDVSWAAARPIGDLTQVEPIEGSAPSQRTEVRILFDDQSIFVGVACFDTDPSAIVATQMLRDVRLDPDDSINLFFDPFFDRRNAFWFQAGPAGGKGDALITKNGSKFNKEWDGIWFLATRVAEEGWFAEMEIPVATINFDPDAPAWGFNFERKIRRHNERVRWASPENRVFFFSVADAGTLHGIQGLHQGVGLDVVPFVVGDYVESQDSDDRDRLFDAGLDAFYRITPSTKVSVSINTDFAETEVDERQVNLSRFPLFFPEKRDFFLEDSGVFFFGPSTGYRRSSDVTPFFSRRIGLDADGGEVPILAATKLTGQTEDWSFGVMDVQTDESGATPEKNLFVGRVSRNLGEQSDLGMILTHGNPTASERNDVYGLDFNYRTSRYREDKNLRLSSYVLRSDSEGAGRDDMAYHLGVNYPNDEVRLSGSYTVVEDNFDPAMGFVRRSGIKKYSIDASYEPRVNTETIRQLRFSLEPTLYTTTGNDMETAELRLTPLGIEWQSGDELAFRVRQSADIVDETFDIADEFEIESGRYDYTRYGVDFRSADKRPISVNAEVFMGGFYGGERTDIELGLDWRPAAWGSFGLDYEINRLKGLKELGLDSDGDEDVHTARLRANLLFGPDLSWSNYFQWDDVSDALGVNSRFWWIIEPGREFFFVVNQGWTLDHDTFKGESVQVSAKLGYTLRF